MERGTHRFSFSYYEGAVRRAKRANEKKQENSFRSFPASFVPAAFGCRGLRPVREQKSESDVRILRDCVDPSPPGRGRGRGISRNRVTVKVTR